MLVNGLVQMDEIPVKEVTLNQVGKLLNIHSGIFIWHWVEFQRVMPYQIGWHLTYVKESPLMVIYLMK